MQTVTDEYIAAMRLGSRTDRITGTIALTDGTVIDVTDEILVNGNLSIDERCMNSFDIGTFYTNQMKLAIYDSEALLHEFANARVELRYGLLVGEEYEEVFLGKYTVDGTNCKRVRDRVYLTAYDRSAKFDRIKCGQIVNTAMPPYNALQLICSECSVTLATAQEEIEAMANGTLSIKCDSSRIETMRDCVMWIAALLGGYARINREGMLEIRKAKYSVDPDDQTTIIVDRVLNSKERISTTFSDTRIYPKFMEAYCGGESKVYSSSYVSTDTQARAGSFSLPENPLVISLSAEKQDEINGNILDFLDNFKQRNIKATIFGDPAIECGDTVKCTGGSIDVGRNIVGVITRYTWKFRQQSTIQCVAPAEGEITAESDVSAFSVEAASEAAEGAFVMPRAQSEKRSSGVAAGNKLSKLEYVTHYDSSEQKTLLDAVSINGVNHYIYYNYLGELAEQPIYYACDENGGALSADLIIDGSISNVDFDRINVINSLIYGGIVNGLPKRERLVLFDSSNGGDGDEITGGWTMRERMTDEGVTAIQPYIYPNTLVMVQNSFPAYSVIETVNKLDFSEYSKIVITCTVNSYGFGGGNSAISLYRETTGLSSNKSCDLDLIGNATHHGRLFGESDSQRLYLIDLSEVSNKEGYFGIINYVQSAGDNFHFDLTVNKIWLEK